MTKPKRHMYRIQYLNDSYQIVEWTKDEFKQVGEDMRAGFDIVALEDGIFRVRDVRAIVYLPPVPEKEPPTQQEVDDMQEKAKKQFEEWGFVDQATMEWLVENGIMDMGGDENG